jgi:hypothetical protein
MIKKRYIMILFIIALLIVALLLILKLNFNKKAELNIQRGSDFFGVTFSNKFAKEIGLDWRENYIAILDDLEVKLIRLPIYWDEVEKEPGLFNFSDYDFMISEGEKRNVQFIVNIGQRLPRWPECHTPEWTEKKSKEDIQRSILIMLEKVVNRYKGQKSIIAWQLENEPFFNNFGICPPSDKKFFEKEFNLLKRLDNRPVIVSATGELSWWRKEAKYADIFASTLYRVVWGPYIGYTRYPIPRWFYNLKAWLVGIKAENRIIVELQAEPWAPSGSIIYLSEKEANKSFNINQFKANLNYVQKMNWQQTYLWGVEWWYWQYKNANPEYWQIARQLFK